ncbi:MAG: cytochrome c3 family protein [Eggerthellaceae bacterium]|nr:cytochrome c3 family protein [Eggerthellaceae bacterium]
MIEIKTTGTDSSESAEGSVGTMGAGSGSAAGTSCSGDCCSCESASSHSAGTAGKSKRLQAIVLSIVAFVLFIALAGCAPFANATDATEASDLEEFIAMFEATHGPGDPHKLVSVHYAESLECTDCHFSPDTTNMGNDSFCLESCHSREAIIAATNDYAGLFARGISTSFRGLDEGLNPHRSHMEGVQCGDCHKMHSTSMMDCNECHYLPLPEGWSDMWNGLGSPKL